VAPQDAAYATIAAVALHGARLSQAGLGDVVAVVGLGLVGQLTMELVAAAGAIPLGSDPDPRRVALAREAGFFATGDADELAAEAARLTSGRGADAALVTAAAPTSAPLADAVAAVRERAVVCVVGDVAIESPRTPLFQKEISLVVSRSYGPGRYDPAYEERGVDYPAGYVRWTEGRNLEEVLRLMATGALRPSRLTTHTFDLEDGPAAYRALSDDDHSVGILLRYSGDADATGRSIALAPKRRARPAPRAGGSKRPRVGVIGAGTFARGVLLPAVARRADIAAVAAANGLSARASADRFGAGLATTDVDELLADETIEAVVIATRHDSHADYAARALRAGKHVLVEKPLSIDRDGLAAVADAARAAPGILMVGFNRRFAPLAVRLHEALSGRGPVVASMRVNAGPLERSHWVHDREIGGGRIVGEVCHFVDLAAYFAGAPPVSVTAAAVGGGSEPRDDNLVATVSLADGSVATIAYAAFGDSGLAKERIEVLAEPGAGTIDDFRELRLHRGGKREAFRSSRDKGHTAEVEAFFAACESGEQPWPLEDMVAVTEATFDLRDAVQGRVGA
jgi:predicted dehydrogenase